MRKAWVIDGDRWAVLPKGVRVTAVDFYEDGMVARARGRAHFVPRQGAVALHLHALPPPAAAPPPAPEKRLFGRKRDPEAEREAAELEKIRALALAEAGKERTRGGSASLSPRGQELLVNLASRGLLSIDLRLTIHAAGSAGPFKIFKNDFDYSCLGEQRLSHSLDYFLILIEDLLAYFPRAANREHVERFLEALDPAAILYASEEDADRIDFQLRDAVRHETEPPA